MTKIVINSNEIKNAYDKMLEYVKVIEENIGRQTEIIKDLNNAWVGKDYAAFFNQWQQFTYAKDDKIKSQLIQYNKFLLGFYLDTITTQDKILCQAKNLPQ